MTKLTMTVDAVSPAKAQTWLQKNTGNRKISPVVVRRYARAMEKGEWRVNGEALKFDAKGRLLDGQHRLLAIVQSGTTIQTCVIHGLPSDCFKTIDSCRARTAGDCLYVLDYKNPHALAAAGRMLFAYENLSWGIRVANFRKASNDELLATLDRHPGLVVAADDYMRKPYMTRLITHSTGMLVFYLGSLVSGPKVRAFFKQLATGEYDSTLKTHSPRVLRERLEQTSREVIKPSGTVRLAWTITAWNTFAQGEPLRRLSRTLTTVPRLNPDPIKPRKQRITVDG